MGWLVGIVLLSFIIVFFLVLAVFNRHEPVTAEARLQDMERFYRDHNKPIATKMAEAPEFQGSFYERIIQPLGEMLSDRFGSLSTARIFTWLEDKLKTAGLAAKWTPWEFLVLWAALVLIGGISGLFYAVSKNMTLLRFLMAIFVGGALGGASVPYYLSMRIKERQREIQRALPDVLDLLTVSVEAGLSFDGALVKLAEKMKGPLVEELTRVLQEMRIGIPRKTALTAMAKRCDVEDLSLFVSAIVQADQLGVGIAKVLRIQAAEARDKRRMKIRELAMKAPIKMLFPLVFLILPALFVVVLGPAVLSIIKAFVK